MSFQRGVWRPGYVIVGKELLQSRCINALSSKSEGKTFDGRKYGLKYLQMSILRVLLPFYGSIELKSTTNASFVCRLNRSICTDIT